MGAARRRDGTSPAGVETTRSRAPAAAAYTDLVPRTFHIRTFGCQMNEHDSERLAGLLVADGLEQLRATWSPPTW